MILSEQTFIEVCGQILEILIAPEENIGGNHMSPKRCQFPKHTTKISFAKSGT